MICMTMNNITISIKTNNSTYTADLNSGCCDIDEMITAYKGLLVQAGFHPHTVDGCFNTTSGDWFTDDNQPLTGTLADRKWAEEMTDGTMEELIHSQTS